MLEKPLIPWLLVEVRTNPDPTIDTKPFNLSIRVKMEEGEHFRYEAEISFTMVDKISPAHVDWLAADMAQKSLLPAHICRRMLIEGVGNPYKKLPYVVEPSEVNEYYDGIVPALFPIPAQTKLTQELSERSLALPGMMGPGQQCPVCGYWGAETLALTVIHMNDYCNLTREQIAAILQSWHNKGTIDIGFKVGEPYAQA